MAIRENRLLSIEEKIFTLHQVRELSSLIFSEYEISKKTNPQTTISIYVKCFDLSSFESEDPAIFNDNSIITKRRVKTIVVEYRDGKAKHIKLRLSHGFTEVDSEHISDSDVEIGGTESIWVGGIADKFNITLDSFPKQNGVIAEHENELLFAAFIIGMFAFGSTIDFMHRSELHFVSYWRSALNTWGDVFANLIGAALLGGVPMWAIAGYFTGKADSIWPITELQIGPDHTLSEKRKRNLLSQVMLVLIVPFILSIITSLISAKLLG